MRNKVTREVKERKREYYRNKLEQTKGDQKNTWKILNDLTGKKSDVSEIRNIKTSTCKNITDAKHIANHLNDYFIQIGPNLASKISTEATDY